MSTPAAARRTVPATPTLTSVAVVRAVLALVWAAALLVAVGDDAPRTSSDVPTAAAALLATYPLIDAVASLLSASRLGVVGRTVRVNAAISAVAVIAVGVAAFAGDAGATLATFGVWAAVSGALQLVVALRRRAAGGQLPLIVSGGLSTLVGLSFVAAAGGTDANLRTLGGYMALGAILFLVGAYLTRRAQR